MSEVIEKVIDEYTTIKYKKSNIYIIERIFNEEFCDRLINFIEKMKLCKTDYHKRNNVKCYMISMEEILKKNEIEYYPFTTDPFYMKNILEKIKNKQTVYQNELNGLKKKDIQQIEEIMTKQLQVAQNIMKNLNDNIVLTNHSGFCFRKIYGNTRQHSDGIHLLETNKNVKYIKNNKDSSVFFARNCSFVISLNDNYDGGLFRFPVQDVELKLKKGSIIVFPPYWTHPHETSELENDTFRYTVNSWGLEPIET